MKKLLLILLLLIVAKAGIAQQLSLSGTIKGAAKRDSVEINVSYDGSYWKNNSVYLKPDVSGNFHIALPYHTEKFIILLYKKAKQNILLSPGRPLYVTINNKLPHVFNFTGKAKPENDLLQKLQLEDVHNLPFIKEISSKNSYINWSVDSVINIRLPAIRHSLDSVERLVARTTLPKSTKRAIATEIKYFYASAISEDLGGRLNNRKNRIGFNTHFIDTVLTNFVIPTKNELDISISANSYLDTYFRYKLWKAMYLYGTDSDKEHAAKILNASIGLDIKSMMNDPDRGSEQYYFTTHLKTAAPQYAWEKSLANLMFNFCMSGQLQSADKLLHFIRANCTNPQYITACEKMFNPLKKARDKYASNLNIKIRPDYRNILSLKALLAPYKGKIVLVDMWFTQCPPCREDLNYEPALKNRLKGKDIVFLNIAREEDKDDEVWRDFIFINNITGEHVRRTANQIGPLWNELGVIDSEQAYPHYFIFDRGGNLVVSNAKRPSDGDALYIQLESALNK